MTVTGYCSDLRKVTVIGMVFGGLISVDIISQGDDSPRREAVASVPSGVIGGTPKESVSKKILEE